MKQRVILVGVPYHGNLGDGAIYYAEHKFITDYFKTYEFYHISENGMRFCIDRISKFIKDDDIIFMHGGGNMGNLYKWQEEGRRITIEKFKNNKIISFPQTMFFEDNEDGKKEFEKTKSIYNAHPNLTLIARESKSYQKMKQSFPKCKVLYTPDIVTYLDETKENSKRKGALLVMRNDREMKISNAEQEQIIRMVKKHYEDISITDTHLREDIAMVYGKRIDTLNKKFDEFRRAKLVITDRLHGMIFAAITSTPCIALGNSNHKIESSVEWFDKLKYIKYANSIEQIEEYIEELKKLDNMRYDNNVYKEYFNQILNIVK